MNGKHLCSVALLCILAAACTKPSGHLKIGFSFHIDGTPLERNTFLYHNAADNLYKVTDLQFFISNVVLTMTDGTRVPIISDKAAHYVDANLDSTLSWFPVDELPCGTYKSIEFCFGLAPELNYTGAYPSAPENNMSWPALLGGGYHYMKINGFWQSNDHTAKPFAMHTGRTVTDGQTTDHSFTVSLPLSHLSVSKEGIANLTIAMNINGWFNTPNLINLDVTGGSIMQDRQIQEQMSENGTKVFTVQ